MRLRARLFSALLLLPFGGCVTQSDVNRAAFALEAAWQNDYEAVLDEDGFGDKRFPAPKHSMRSLLRRSGCA
jgi:hypothetical protein